MTKLDEAFEATLRGTLKATNLEKFKMGFVASSVSEETVAEMHEQVSAYLSQTLQEEFDLLNKSTNMHAILASLSNPTSLRTTHRPLSHLPIHSTKHTQLIQKQLRRQQLLQELAAVEQTVQEGEALRRDKLGVLAGIVEEIRNGAVGAIIACDSNLII